MSPLLLALFISSLQAKTLTTSYLSIEVPDDWNCSQSQSEWVCQPAKPQLTKTAVLLLSAKQARADETLEGLTRQLDTPTTVPGPSQKLITSQKQWSRNVTLAGSTWNESLHSNREIHGFYSYYLIGKHNGLSILLNLSYQSNYAKQFNPLIERLRETIQLTPTNFEQTQQANPASTAPLAPPPVVSQSEEPVGQTPWQKFMWPALIVAGVLAALVWIRRK